MARLTRKQRLARMEGRHHDRKRLTRTEADELLKRYPDRMGAHETPIPDHPEPPPPYKRRRLRDF